MSRTIKFREIERLIKSLGFNMHSVKGSHRVFRHNLYGTTIVLPHRSGNADVSQAHLAAIRRTLLDAEIIDRLEFDSLLLQKKG